jgi:hypothetical protein
LTQINDDPERKAATPAFNWEVDEDITKIIGIIINQRGGETFKILDVAFLGEKFVLRHPHCYHHIYYIYIYIYVTHINDNWSTYKSKYYIRWTLLFIVLKVDIDHISNY